MEKALPFYTQSPSQLTDKQAQARTVMNHEVGRDFIAGEVRSFDLLEALRAIRCPTLLLAGELDPICPVQASDDIAKRIPAELLTYRRYPSCGHGAYRDVPEAFDEIRRFIEA